MYAFRYLITKKMEDSGHNIYTSYLVGYHIARKFSFREADDEGNSDIGVIDEETMGTFSMFAEAFPMVCSKNNKSLIH